MPENTLAGRLEKLRGELRTAAAAGGWPAPKLIAVSKTHPLEEILPLKALGVTDVGENRVQEIRAKLPGLKENFHIHLIGQLQRNKVRAIIGDVCLIQSLDRWELALEIDRQAQAHGLRMPVLVQLSPVGEPQKGGLPPEEAEDFIRRCGGLPGLEVRGLMAVMPDWRDETALEPLFRQMRTRFDRLREAAPGGAALTELSMGMSGDCLIAARCGATMVRVGSAIFGPRVYPDRPAV